jgi:hypothetical protein
MNRLIDFTMMYKISMLASKILLRLEYFGYYLVFGQLFGFKTSLERVSNEDGELGGLISIFYQFFCGYGDQTYYHSRSKEIGGQMVLGKMNLPLLMKKNRRSNGPQSHVCGSKKCAPILTFRIFCCYR